MKYIFAILLIIHGLIHLMGFAFALFNTETNKQVLGISKPVDAIWLMTFICFVVASSQFLLNRKWFYIAFVAVLLSQMLIITVWQEAKYGTLVNIIILLASLASFGNYRFQKMVESEANTLLKSNIEKTRQQISSKDLEKLPDIVAKWLKNSGVLERGKANTIYIRQQGQMRTKKDGKWMPFTAEQYVNAETSSFVWNTIVEAMPPLYLFGRDKLMGGKGEMLIKLAGLIPVVNEKENHKIDSGAMLRYLGEICWIPFAAIDDNMSWQTIDKTSATATLTIKGESVSGIFKFTESGDFKSFEAERYYGGRVDAKKEKWVITASKYNIFDGIKSPSVCNVTWKFKEGDFYWLDLNITDIKYDDYYSKSLINKTE